MVLWDNELESLSVLIAGHYYMMAKVFVWNLIPVLLDSLVIC